MLNCYKLYAAFEFQNENSARSTGQIFQYGFCQPVGRPEVLPTGSRVTPWTSLNLVSNLLHPPAHNTIHYPGAQIHRPRGWNDYSAGFHRRRIIVLLSIPAAASTFAAFGITREYLENTTGV